MGGKLTFIDLFAGVGGLSLGFERAGMICKAHVEVDNYATRVLEKHWPDVPRFRDIRDCGKHNLPAVDVICGGFPCQPFSVAGKRGGNGDDRYLWPEMLRVISGMWPAWVVGENVTGINSMVLDEMLSNLASIGYEAIPLEIPACGVGAWHKRLRTFTVAHSDCKRKLYGQGSRKDDWIRPIQIHIDAGGYWASEPGVARVVYGVSNRVDRLKCLGNAVVPQLAEVIGRAIVEVENGRQTDSSE